MATDNPGSAVVTVASIDEAIAFTRRNDLQNNPRMRHRDKVVLRDTNRMVIWAELCEIVDEHTGELHHKTLKIVSAQRTSVKLGNQIIVSGTDQKRIWLDDEKGEIAALSAFLAATSGFSGDPGDYSILPTPNHQLEPGVFNRLIALASEQDQATHLVQILEKVEERPELLSKLVEVVESNPDVAKIAAASLNLARYTNAIGALEQLISENAREGAFQSLLEEHPWMFGGEYSTRLNRRRFTRDENADFMMRRTVDDYLELIEIKRPLSATLFFYDDSHDSYYPSSSLNEVVGQVMKYLDEIDASRDNIERRDNVRINKIRARIIIGLDHDQTQVDALRLFNSHLHRIEIMTFDQLLATAKRVRDNLAEELRPIEHSVEGRLTDVPY